MLMGLLRHSIYIMLIYCDFFTIADLYSALTYYRAFHQAFFLCMLSGWEFSIFQKSRRNPLNVIFISISAPAAGCVQGTIPDDFVFCCTTGGYVPMAPTFNWVQDGRDHCLDDSDEGRIFLHTQTFSLSHCHELVT